MSQGDNPNQFQSCGAGPGGSGHDGPAVGLTAESAAALDALISARGRVEGLPVAQRLIAGRAQRLLGALELDGALLSELERSRSRVIAGVRAAARSAHAREAGAGLGQPAGIAGSLAQAQTDAPADLIAQDADAIDALVAAGWQTQAVAPEHRARAAAAMRLCGVLDGGGEADARVGGDGAVAGVGGGQWAAQLEGRRAEVIGGVLAAVSSDVWAERGRLRLDPAQSGAGGRRGWSLGDVASLAAVLVIGTAVALPVLSAIREEGRRLACQSNLGAVAAAIGAYQSDNRQSLPMASLSLAGTSWWDVGTDAEHSNSANLYTIVRQGYAELAQVACSNAPAPTLGAEIAATRADWERLENVSYSYQNLFGRPGGGLAWRDCLKPSVVVSDRSPVIVRARAGDAWIDPMENSPNHGGLGQWVVLQDGSAEWMNTPIKSCGDNIWLPEDVERLANEQGQMRRGGRVRSLRGVETPLTREDAFMTP